MTPTVTTSTTTTAAVKPNNLASQKGLGRAYYFLDQMRTEISDADRTIKSLQSEIKGLQSNMKLLVRVCVSKNMCVCVYVCVPCLFFFFEKKNVVNHA